MADFTQKNGLEYVDVVRDVVRLAAVANMREQMTLEEAKAHVQERIAPLLEE
jgi:hypothetical protein